jgi:hypothetical protein
MNPERMAERGLNVLSASSGTLSGYGLRFNTRSHHDASLACANVIYAPGECVEGVLYHLATSFEVAKLDPHEGTPVMYSRELFLIRVASRFIPAWTYIANPAVIGDGLIPARWYVEHLLAGKAYLSPEYWDRIDQTICKEAVDVTW